MTLDPSCKQEDIQIRSSISVTWDSELQLTLNSHSLTLNLFGVKRTDKNTPYA